MSPRICWKCGRPLEGSLGPLVGGTRIAGCIQSGLPLLGWLGLRAGVQALEVRASGVDLQGDWG